MPIYKSHFMWHYAVGCCCTQEEAQLKRLARILFALSAIVLLAPLPQAGAVLYNDPRAGNPLVPGYFADPCCRKFGDTYYLYATPDGWGVGEGPFIIWTSKDFVHWTGNKSNWPTTTQKWAPSVVYANSQYYMYTQVPCQVWVGVGSTPLGPFTNPISGGGCMIPDQTPFRTITLDGECFIDTDGQAYLYYGTWWTPTVVKLNPDLISTVAGSAIQFFSHDSYTPPNGTVQGCMEAPYMFKHNSKYYYMYSNNQCGDSTYDVEYSTGTSPLGPWTYGANNPILSTNLDDTVDGPGHHTILEDGGKVYIIYHRHDNPHNADGSHRQVCADELIFNGDGSIAKVVPTHNGIGYLAASTKKDTNLAIGKTATASSNAGSDWLPSNAADENNGTLWKAGSYTYPQWLTIDLGSSMSFKRCETEFQFSQVAYTYRIEYSTNGTTWATFVNRTTNTSWGPMVDSVASPVTGRYIRITITGDDSSGRPSPEVGIWNFKIYDGVDKADPTPIVDAGPDKTGTTAFPTLPLTGSLVYATGPVTYTWSKVGGPGTVTFTNSGKLNATATFGSMGAYTLQLSANDGTHTGADTVGFNILAPGDKVISYPMEETSGVYVTDTSNNAQDGILMNGATRGTGAVGNCVSFDGINDYLYVPPLLTYTTLSVSAWIKLDTIPSYGSIICGNGSATGRPYLSIQSTGKIQFSIVGGNPVNQTSTFAFTDKTLGKWTHIAVVYDKATKNVKFYVNGKQDRSVSYSSAQSAVLTSGARIAGWDGGGRNFDGKIDELVVYNRALSATEISTTAGSVSFPTVGDAKKLANGQSITLKARSVTYAPRDTSTLARGTTFFYIGEPDRSSYLRVEDGLTGQDAADAGGGATITGVININAYGERYLTLSSPPEIESAPVVAPAFATTKGINAGSVAVGALVKTAGTVQSVASDRKSMTIWDGLTKKVGSTATKVYTTVKCEYGTIGSEISATNTVSVIGVVNQSSATDRVILLRQVRRLVPAVPAITNGLVAWYKLDETSGTTASDSSGNGKNGTLVNGPTWGAGMIGGAIVLDGVDDYILLPTGLMSAVTDFTVCAWAKLDANNGWNRIFDFGTGTSNYMFLTPSAGGGPLRYAITTTSNGSEQQMDAPSALPIGGWQHVAVTLSGTTGKLYVNGALVSTNTSMTLNPASLGSTNQNYIGKSQWGDPLFDGKIDDFRIYNRALSASEISQIYAGY